MRWRSSNELKKQMARAGHNASSLALLLGLSRQGIYRWLHGGAPQSPAMRQRVAEALRCDPATLWNMSYD
jgi:hypothetical protein